MTKQVTENLRQAQEQQMIYSWHVDKAWEYYKKYQEEIKQASKAKVSQWKHEKTASNIYWSGLAFWNYAYAWWDEWLKEKITPQILKDFYLEDCRITQEEDHHIKEWWGSMYATDIACERWKSFDVKAPSVNDWYLLVKKWYDQKLWNYIVLDFDLTQILFAHTTTSLKEWDKVDKWAIIWNTDLSWISQNHHVHIEIWRNNQWVMQNIKYPSRRWYWSGYYDVVINEKSEELLEQRKPKLDQIYYFTHYDPWVVAQNDNSPCIAASWKDICEMMRNGQDFVAITVDIRKQMWIKRWDKVRLVGDPWCAWVYSVEDEMNKRFRTQCIKRPWTDYCIKWDMAKAWGACKIELVK